MNTLIGHKNVSFVLKSLCMLYPEFHENYYIKNYMNNNIINSVLNLYDELFFLS